MIIKEFPPLIRVGVSAALAPLLPKQFGFQCPCHIIWWVPETFFLPIFMFVAGACCCQKTENTAFELFLQSAWECLSPGKQAGRSSTPCWNRSKVWRTESKRFKDIYSRDTNVENRKNFEKKLSPLCLYWKFK